MSKKILFVLSIVVLLTSCSKIEQPKEEPIDERNLLKQESLIGEHVLWHGRHHLQDDEVYFYYPSTGFTITFTGSAVDITLSLRDQNSDVYFTLARDGEPLLEGETVILSEETQTITVTFDTYGEHTVDLIKRSEPRDGVTSLLSLETNGAFQAVEQPSEDTPHFLLIGASGISGNGALGESWEDRTTANSSSLHSFGYLSAARFNGTFEFVSNSGFGLAFGYNDPSGDTNIMDAYEHIGLSASRALIDVPYDHHNVPDIIIINIGGNDYSAVINKLTGFAREEKIQEFKQAVADFIFTLREDAPNAHIFWTMTSGSQNGAAAKSIIDLLPAKDKAFVHIVIINSVGEDGPVGANNHASYETHIASTDALVEAIELYTTYRIND